MAQKRGSFWFNLIGSILVFGAVVLVSVLAGGGNPPTAVSTDTPSTLPPVSDPGATHSGGNSNENPSAPPVSPISNDPSPTELPVGFSYSEAMAVMSYYAAQIDGMVSPEEKEKIREFLATDWAGRIPIEEYLNALAQSWESGELERTLQDALNQIGNLSYEDRKRILTEIWVFFQELGMGLNEIASLTGKWMEENLNLNIYDIYDSLQNRP